MKAKSALLYIRRKYIHELYHDNYMMDMLRMIASSNLKETPERYFDMIKVKRNSSITKIDYNVNDVVDMFAGRGRLV